MNKPDILVVGNCTIDDVMVVAEYPSLDDEVRAIDSYRALGGNACNCAIMLSVLGLQVELMASMAQDLDADWLIKQLHDKGIDTNNCLFNAHQSIPKSSIWLDHKTGDRTIVHYRDLCELDLQHLLKVEYSQAQWIHFEGRNIENLLKLFKRKVIPANCRISLEIEKPRKYLEQLITHVDVVIVSSHYLKQKSISAKQCIEQFQSINNQLQMVCTLGSKGLMASDSNGSFIKMEAEYVEPHKIIDTIGAGDCFIAGLISQLHGGETFYNALEFANKLSARKIQNRGMKLDG